MLIFGAGVVTGGLLVRTRVAQNASPEPASPNPSGPVATFAPGRQAFIQRVRRELDLTSEQSQEVDRIMRESQKRTAKIYEPVAPQAREETRRARQEIMAVLTPEQKKKFNQSVKRQRDLSEDRRRAPGESNAFARPQ